MAKGEVVNAAQTDIEPVWRAVVQHSVAGRLRSSTFVFPARDVEAANLHLSSLISKYKLEYSKVSKLERF